MNGIRPAGAAVGKPSRTPGRLPNDGKMASIGLVQARLAKEETK
jgi:hypothetical protein